MQHGFRLLALLLALTAFAPAAHAQSMFARGKTETTYDAITDSTVSLAGWMIGAPAPGLRDMLSKPHDPNLFVQLRAASEGKSGHPSAVAMRLRWEVQRTAAEVVRENSGDAEERPLVLLVDDSTRFKLTARRMSRDALGDTRTVQEGTQRVGYEASLDRAQFCALAGARVVQGALGEQRFKMDGRLLNPVREFAQKAGVGCLESATPGKD